MGASRDHQLIADDEGSLSRIIQLHSEDKDHYAFYYADIVSSAMAGKFSALAWVELFAGPGRLWVEPRDAYVDGSPVRAMKVRRPYDYYVFNDLDPQCVAALEPRVKTRSGVHVLGADANSDIVAEYLIKTIPKTALIILYGDPAGLHLHFDTLARLANHFPHLDLLLNLPVSGIIRALRGEASRATAAGKPSRTEFRKAAAVLGHDDPIALISGGPNTTWGPSIRTWYENRLRGIGFDHFQTEVIRNQQRNSALYDLMIASRNPKAVQFFNEAVLRGPNGRYALFGS